VRVGQALRGTPSLAAGDAPQIAHARRGRLQCSHQRVREGQALGGSPSLAARGGPQIAHARRGKPQCSLHRLQLWARCRPMILRWSFRRATMQACDKSGVYDGSWRLRERCRGVESCERALGERPPRIFSSSASLSGRSASVVDAARAKDSNPSSHGGLHPKRRRWRLSPWSSTARMLKGSRSGNGSADIPDV